MREENFLEKSLPSNEDAEQLILGSILLDNRVTEQVIPALKPSDFYSPLHRTIFQCMVGLHTDDEPIDPITIGEYLKLNGKDPAIVGGVSFVTNLTRGVPYLSDISDYIHTVKKHSVARDTLRLLHRMTDDIIRGEEAVEEILEQGESSLLSLSNRVHSEVTTEDKGFWDLRDITPTLEQQFWDYNAGISNGAPSGMQELDKMLDGGGFQPGGVYLIGASEKTGKTSLALDWASHGATVLGITVPIVTLEMSKENLAKRLYSAHTGIPYYMFRPGFYDSQTDNSFTRAIEGLKSFGEFPIKIADRLFGMNDISRNLRRVCEMGLKAGKPVKYAIIDYLQLIEPDETGKGSSTREREVSGISRALKKLATELGIALIVMSSLNRDGLREGQEPTPFNLRDSGALAFDCEALILLHNPAFIPGKPYEPRQITDMVMIVSRQRNGPTGRIPMKFIGPYMQFMTESQFRKHFKGEGLPKSVGQATEEDREMDKLWDTTEPTEQTARDRDGDDVPWD